MFFFALFCLCVGSFLNAVIHRLPLMLFADWKAQCSEYLELPFEAPEKINLFYPRSFCPQCKTLISAWHNIPLISYLFLQGKCNKCHKSIPIRYFFVEAFTLASSLLALWQFGFSLQLVFALLFIWISIIICFIDLKHQIIPDSLSLSLLWLGLLANTMGLFTSLPNAVLSAISAYLFLWFFIQLFYLITGKIGMGNGDFKLYAAFGAWFGWTTLPFILLFSSLVGAIVGIIYLKTSKQNKATPIPFGPFLVFAGLVSLFWGQAIMQWYINLLH
jgi:leader peptidase (prepilin peptidase)/N-methyltransferase